MKIVRSVVLVSAILATVGTVLVGFFAVDAATRASSDSAEAQAKYLSFSTQLEELEEEQERAQRRLREIPSESTEAWRLCAYGIVNDAFNTPKSAAEEAACDEYQSLEVELARLEVREASIPAEIQSARNQKNDWQVRALSADQNFSTTITFWAVGTGLLAVSAVGLWVTFARISTRKEIRFSEDEIRP